MRKTRRRSRSVSGDLQFGSDVAESLGLPIEEVAAIVGAIVGGRAAGFVVATFPDVAPLTKMIPAGRSTNQRIDQICEDCRLAGAARIVCARPASPESPKPSEQNMLECGGVSFAVVVRSPQGKEMRQGSPLETK